MSSKRAFFPGSFDPFTKGHEAVLMKALTLFDEVVVGIGVHSSKSAYFTLESRKAHIESVLNTDRIKVISYKGLTVDACRANQCDFIVRGLRDTKDFQYERPIAYLNQDLGAVETIFILTERIDAAINSTIVREIYQNEGEISKFVTNPMILIKQ
jgi:pantetheine-phosphate adenylyltransferase